MLEMILGIAGWPGIALGGGAILAVLALIVVRIRASGRDAERLKQAKADARARELRDEIADAVAGRTAEENRGRLGRWSRN